MNTFTAASGSLPHRRVHEPGGRGGDFGSLAAGPGIRVSLYESLYRRLRDDILSGALAAGERLPSKRALAEHLRVSVVTVEGAYQQLEAEGYVDARPRRGFFISSVDPRLPAEEAGGGLPAGAPRYSAPAPTTICSGDTAMPLKSRRSRAMACRRAGRPWWGTGDRWAPSERTGGRGHADI